MNTNQKGNIAVGKAIAHYTSLGYIVSVPLTDSQKYDLIIDDASKLIRVQVKYTTRITSSKFYGVGLRLVTKISGGKYTSVGFMLGDFDELFVVTPENSYRIPATFTNTNMLTLNKTYVPFIV